MQKSFLFVCRPTILAKNQNNIMDVFGFLIGCTFESNCPLLGPGSTGGVLSVRVFLRYPSPYLREFPVLSAITPPLVEPCCERNWFRIEQVPCNNINILLRCGTRAHLLSPDEGWCCLFSTRSNYCEFLAWCLLMVLFSKWSRIILHKASLWCFSVVQSN